MRFKQLAALLNEDLIFHANGKSKIRTFLFNQNLRLLRWFRIAVYLNNTNLSPLTFLYKNWMLFFFGCDLSLSANIGRRFRFAHPIGIVIGAGVQIGDDCVIYQNVTLGAKGGRKSAEKKYPVIQDNVVVYASAIIIGGVTIEDNSIVGAMSLVTRDVKTNTTVAGIPAQALETL